MRIALVCDYYLDYTGGTQSSLREQARALRAAGHDVVLIGATTRRRVPELATGALAQQPSTRIELPARMRLPGVALPLVLNRRRLRDRLAAEFAERGIELVHVQTELGLAHAAVDAARMLGLAVVHTVHTFYWRIDSPLQRALVAPSRALLRGVTRHRMPRTPLPARPLEQTLRNMTLGMAHRADAVISPSQHQADDLAASGLAVPLHVLANPAAIGGGRPASPVDASGPLRVLWVGRMETEKRPLQFAEAAMAAIEASAHPITVDMVGAGSLLGTLRARTREQPAITVHGGLTRDRVAALLDDASVLALSSIGFDNQPMTISEAISRHRGVLYGDPRLADSVGAAGVLARDASVPALAEAMVRLAGSTEEVRMLGDAARVEAERFQPAGYAEAVGSVYDEARQAAEAGVSARGR